MTVLGLVWLLTLVLSATSSPLELSLTNLTALCHCVNYQLKGSHDQLLSAEQAQALLLLRRPAKVGLVTVEDPEKGFVSLAKEYFHFFHFLEFAVIGFAEMQHTLPTFDLAWWYTPLMTQKEICGTAAGINCLIMQMIFPSITSVHGLESNPPALQQQHEAYRGTLRKRNTEGDVYVLDDTATHRAERARYEKMLEEVDIVLLINRSQCKREQRHRIHKIWTNYLDSFPAQAWYDSVTTSLKMYQNASTYQQTQSQEKTPMQKLIVCYIDRQSTKRNLPDAFHTWMLQFLRQNDAVELRHLRMERYAAVEQVLIARQCHATVGAHGNGLSHLLWMTPGSAVLEVYWDFNFHFDYASAAQLMNHTYRGIYNGELLDPERIMARDSKMLKCCTTTYPRQLAHWNMTAGQQAVRDFVQLALQQRGIEVAK